MAKYKIGIQLIETYNKYVIVDANSIGEAREKVEEVWEQDDGYLYDETTDCCDNMEVRFFEHGEADENDVKIHDNLDRFETE